MRRALFCSKAFRLKANRLRHALTPMEDDRAKVLASRVTKIRTIRDIRRPARTRTGCSSRQSLFIRDAGILTLVRTRRSTNVI